MRRPRPAIVAGLVVLAVAMLVALQVAAILPFGYDARAYWLAAQHFTSDGVVYPAPDAPLGQPDEFHYLPIVLLPFIALLPLPIDAAVRVFIGLELALAIALGIALVRGLPPAARPWAAAAYVAFLPLVLEVTLGNVDMLSLVLALVAWHWRDRAWRAAVPLSAAVGIKFLGAVLLPFYLAAGRGRVVWRALALGVVALAVTLPILWRQTLEYVALVPRYAATDWVRAHVQREDPAWLAGIVWTDAFAVGLSLIALAAGVVCGRRARADPARETDWHHVALALAPYLAPFGFFWTTVLVTSLPLFVVTLARALRLPPAARAVTLLGLAGCWLLMQAAQVHDLGVPVMHLAGVVALVGIALVLMRHERDQTLGRSTPRSRATVTASG